MRYGLLADIHSNLEALQTVLNLCNREGINDFLCLGDIVGYGANPKECLHVVRGLKMAYVAGNHDWAVAGRLDPVYFSLVAKEAVYWTRKQLSSEETDFLNDLPLVFERDDYVLVHGTLSEPERFHYMMYLTQAAETFSLMDKNLCFIGHSHSPQIIVQRKGKNWCSDSLRIEIDPSCKYIVNVGSVGQPRDGNPLAAYGIYDTDARIIEIKRTSYDIPSAKEKIIKAGLPVSFAERLTIGH